MGREKRQEERLGEKSVTSENFVKRTHCLDHEYWLATQSKDISPVMENVRSLACFLEQGTLKVIAKLEQSVTVILLVLEWT